MAMLHPRRGRKDLQGKNWNIYSTVKTGFKVTAERRFCTSAEKRIQTAGQELEYIFYCNKIGYKGTA